MGEERPGRLRVPWSLSDEPHSLEGRPGRPRRGDSIWLNIEEQCQSGIHQKLLQHILPATGRTVKHLNKHRRKQELDIKELASMVPDGASGLQVFPANSNLVLQQL